MARDHSRPDFMNAEQISVIKTVIREGVGDDTDVLRLVTYYSDPDTGELLAVSDPCGKIT